MTAAERSKYVIVTNPHEKEGPVLRVSVYIPDYVLVDYRNTEAVVSNNIDGQETINTEQNLESVSSNTRSHVPGYQPSTAAAEMAADDLYDCDDYEDCEDEEEEANVIIEEGLKAKKALALEARKKRKTTSNKLVWKLLTEFLCLWFAEGSPYETEQATSSRKNWAEPGFQHTIPSGKPVFALAFSLFLVKTYGKGVKIALESYSSKKYTSTDKYDINALKGKSKVDTAACAKNITKDLRVKSRHTPVRIIDRFCQYVKIIPGSTIKEFIVGFGATVATASPSTGRVTYMRTYMRAYIHTYIHTRTCIHIYIHTYMCTYIHSYTNLY